ncbi:histidine phosphatase family protein [Suipraeoptans intestinalis]|uniref:histidine phosphatase family protein n=1 Tax=Suipraeoptans intestinalis TaxID=2606628 RepID=UPI0023F1F4B1|nr:histidine phosphatase family protein [Suipraeoptans intestinalis]MDD7769538.1 histidine phosphatase family protein [Suipraeoptans intestinalis]MDY3121899.1 histidine phosphatase family protein [Suipraeoptans intestinalis]
MEIYLVRHGETDWNKARLIQGRADIPLNDFGRSLARKTGEGLRDVVFDVCYSSPLQRARETAELIVAGRQMAIREDARLLEMDFGEYEGKCCKWDDWELPAEFRDFFEAPEQYKAPAGGEDFLQVKERTGQFLKELTEKEELQESRILVVSHGAALAGMLNVMRRDPLAKYWGNGVAKNCAVTIVEASKECYSILEDGRVYYDDQVKPW